MSDVEMPEATQGGDGLLAFDDLLLDPRRRQLTRNGQIVPLTRLCYRMLATLVDAAPAMVTQEALMSCVWPGRIVSPETLTQRISLLRRALDDDADAPRYIGLTRGEGYQLLPPVIELMSDQERKRAGLVPDHERSNFAPPAAETSPSKAPTLAARLAAVISLALVITLVSYYALHEPSVPNPSGESTPVRLAVLPFEGQQDNAAQKYFSIGIAEELTMRIARLRAPSLQVVAAVPEPGDRPTNEPAHKVDYILDGTVRYDPNRVHVTARLTRTADLREIWAASYEREPRTLLPIQGEIARGAVRAIGALVTGPPPEQRLPAADGESHDAYLRGRYLMDNGAAEQNLDAAITEFRRVISRDPENANAYAALAFCYNRLGSTGRRRPGEAYASARAAAHTALEIDPKHADAWAALGFVRRNYDWDWRGAEDALLQALRLDPNNPNANHVLGLLYSTLGRHEEAIAAMQRSTARDPIAPISFSNLAVVHVNARQYDRARAIWDNRREGLQSETLRLIRGEFHLLLGEYPQARAILLPLAAQTHRPEVVADLARLYAAVGKADQARAALRQLEAHPSARYALSPQIALANAALGDVDTAFEWLAAAVEEHAARLIFVKVDPAWDPMRGDPRFASVLRTMGLEDS